MVQTICRSELSLHNVHVITFSHPQFQVHRCRELKTQHVYAAKFIPIGHAMEKALIRKEIDIMNHLHHCKLINLHDAFEDEDEMVLIFEL